MKDVENRLQVQIQNEQKLQALLSEQTQLAREENKEWERKYFEIQEKSQRATSELRDLKRIEQEYLQMKQLFSHMQSFFGGTSATPMLTSVNTPRPSEKPSFDTPPANESSNKKINASPNLFEKEEAVSNTQPVKKGLFD